MQKRFYWHAPNSVRGKVVHKHDNLPGKHLATPARLLVMFFAAIVNLAAHPVFAELNFSPCYLTGSSGNGTLQAQCTTWQRPLNPDAPDGEQVELFVAKMPSTALDPASDALTIINGGPGGSSIDLMVDIAPLLQAFTRERDVIVLDQRGTGRSTPLECQALTDTAESAERAEILAATKECLAKLSYDPRYFTTSVAVRDLEALRKAAGYSHLNLYGVSYGTRVAQHSVRRYPNQSRSQIIDGVIPPTTTLGSNVAFNSQDELDDLFERCQSDPDCAERFPTLAADFSRLSTVLKTAPFDLTLQHPVTGVHTDLTLTYGHLAVWLRLALYAPETSALVPLIIDQAANQQNYLPVAASALRMLHQLTDSLNYGMHNAVVCTEDAPFYNDAEEDFASLAGTYLGRDMYDTLKAMCSVWPEGIRDDNLNEPMSSDVPTLVLSGERDPITPARYGEAVLSNYGRVRHVVAPGQGHGTIARGCMARLVLDFVEEPDPQALDTQCVQYMSDFPFFTDLMGPTP